MTDRLPAFIDRLHAHILERYPADKPYTKEAIEQAILPLDIRHFLRYLLEQRPTEAVEDMPYANWFPAHDPAIDNLRRQLALLLKSRVRIPAEEWAEVLHHAIATVMHYLIAPIPVLTEWVFEGEKERPSSEILRRMGYFRAYDFFHRILEGYTRTREVGTLRREEFPELLQRIEARIIGDYNTSDWLEHVQPLYQMASVLPENRQGVPIWLLRRTFKHYPMPDVQRQLLHLEQVVGQTHLSVEGLRELIEARQITRPEPRPTHPPPSEPLKTTSSPSTAIPLWQKFTHRPPATTYHTPAVKRQAPLPRAGQAPAPPSPAAASPPPRPASPSNTDTLGELERQVFGMPIPGERIRFISSLFGGQTDAYTEALRTLAEAPNWERASQIIAYHVFLPHNVNIYSKPAVHFTDLVEAHFKRKS